MTVRSREVVLTRIATNGTVQILYTVPEDRTLIIKSARLRLTGGAGDVSLFVNGPGFPILARGTTPDEQVSAAPGLPLWDVLEDGRQLALFGPSGGSAVTVDVWVSGALLLGDAS